MKLGHAVLFSVPVLAGCNLPSPTPTSAPARAGVQRMLGSVPESERAVWAMVQAAATAQYPRERVRHAMAFHPGTGKTYLFGGTGVRQEGEWLRSAWFDDLWAWDGRGWTEVSSPKRPPGREATALAYDPARQSLLLHGGESPEQGRAALATTWEWTPTAGWNELVVAGSPGSISAHALVTDVRRGKVLLVGGQYGTSAGKLAQTDVWEWDGTQATWTRRTPAAARVAPGELSFPVVSFDDERGKLLVYDGSAGPSTFWEWDALSAGWSHRDSGDPLGDFARPLAGAYDNLRRRHLYHVSDLGAGQFDVVMWELASGLPVWYRRTFAEAPTQAEEAPIVFDAGRGVAVLWTPYRPDQTWEYSVANLADGEGCTAATAASCASGYCVDGVCCATRACGGDCQACNVPEAEGSCAPVAPGTAVAGSCPAAQVCAIGGCKAANGQACASAAACASGFCVDGVCCDEACTGGCSACALPGQAGRCRPYLAGTDPEGECATGSEVCRATCDGTGHCASPGAGSSCGPCLTCDGAGGCSRYDRLCTVRAPEASAVDCFLDSVAGDDARNGHAPAEAVRSQAKLPGDCTSVFYRRGSELGEKLRLLPGVTHYGNYGDGAAPLPRFAVARGPGSGPVIDARATDGVTFDGLSLSGAAGDGTARGAWSGACVALGYRGVLMNSELAGCDTGVMLFDEGSIVQGNFIHDIGPSSPASAELASYLGPSGVGVWTRATNSSISYNVIVSCQGTTTTGCHGGAVVVAAPAGGKIEWVTVDHNYAHGNCGFVALGTPGQGDRGSILANIRYNIAVDSGWLALLDQGHSELVTTIQHDTAVQHAGSPHAGLLMASFDAATGEAPRATSVERASCCLFLADGVAAAPAVDAAVQSSLVVDLLSQAPGVVNPRGASASDYDLVPGSPAIDRCAGQQIEEYGFTDFFGRKGCASPKGVCRADCGAAELGAAAAITPSFFPGAAGWLGTSPTPGTGGVAGAGPAATGGVGGTVTRSAGAGGSGTVPATGGAGGFVATSGGAGGGPGGSGGDGDRDAGTMRGSGGRGGGGGAPVAAGAGGAGGAAGAVGTGGAGRPVDGGGVRDGPPAGSSATGGAGVTGTGTAVIGGKKGCSCRVADPGGNRPFAWLVLVALAWWRRRGRGP